MFCVEIKKIRQKSRDFWFADFFLELFKIHSLAWILIVLNLFHNVLFKVITKFYKHCFIKEDFRKNLCIIRWCLVGQRNPWARPYGLKNLNPSKKPSTVTRQLTKSLEFRQNYLCDFHLRSSSSPSSWRSSSSPSGGQNNSDCFLRVSGQKFGLLFYYFLYMITFPDSVISLRVFRAFLWIYCRGF
jgi:hypothetical protein